MSVRRRTSLALAGGAVIVLSCGTCTPDGTERGAIGLLAESPNAHARIGELRMRFVQAEPPADGAAGATAVRVPVLGAGIATAFERAETGGLRAVLPATAMRGVARAASVELPMRADGESNLEDATSHVSVRFRLHDAKPSPAEVVDGYALYVGALPDADLVHRVYAEGTEDYVVFETRPAREELLYSVNVSRVPGLRLVSNTLEFIDESGSPALRVAPPYVVDALGARHSATLAVSGCAVDARATAPWGRPVTKPGADRCTVHVAWSGVAYPAIVDPTWSATGSMATPRSRHTASVLASGRVLVAGGATRENGGASAELFDPHANRGVGTFAAVGSMTTARQGHTASVLGSGKVLITGGYNGTSAELFDPHDGADTFGATGAMEQPRSGHTATVLLSGKVLVAGGVESIRAELFDPDANGAAGAFSVTGGMVTARRGHTASLLPSGKVLLAGGAFLVGGTGFITTAEIFDPSANGGAGAFATTDAMGTGRSAHTASVLASGRVLLAGGWSGNQYDGVAALATVEMFDPTANGGEGAFTAKGWMTRARYGHTASVLASGKVLVAGGHGGDASAEVFDPEANGGVGAFAATGSMATGRDAHTATVLAATLLAPESVLVTGGIGASAELFVVDACTTGRNCLSGFCADGFCCNTACAGGCDRCDRPGMEGTCVIASAGSPSANPTCAYPFACDGVNASCPASCTSDAACAAAYYCASDSTCHVRPCAQITGTEDTTDDCAPYRCDRGGACRTQCSSVADCVAPTVCNTSHKCVPATQDRSDGGCGVAAASARSSAWGGLQSLVIAAGLAAVAVGRRRTRSARRRKPHFRKCG